MLVLCGLLASVVSLAQPRPRDLVLGPTETAGIVVQDAITCSHFSLLKTMPTILPQLWQLPRLSPTAALS